MTREITKSQIDRLGDRLRKGNITEDDLRFLDLYRRSFSEAYEIVVGTIRQDLALAPTGRPAKSTTSIADKLRRESIRLSQIQDIAGCRLIVPDIANQESVVQSLKTLFEDSTIVDRRAQPSHGYRAVHVVVKSLDKMIEIQVRTALQHLWAELSEKFSDVVDPTIKYGGGNELIQTLLTEASSLVATQESLETQVVDTVTQLSSQENLTDDEKQTIVVLQKEFEVLGQNVSNHLRNIIEKAEKIKGEIDALSD